MNSCYGCIYQRKGIWGNNQFCKQCSPEGSNYVPRDDFDEWHDRNTARQNKGSAEQQPITKQGSEPSEISAIADSLDDMNQVSVYDRNKINQHIVALRKLLPC